MSQRKLNRSSVTFVAFRYNYASGLKGRQGASSNRIVCPSVIASAYIKSAIIKVWVVKQLPNVDCKFI